MAHTADILSLNPAAPANPVRVIGFDLGASPSVAALGLRRADGGWSIRHIDVDRTELVAALLLRIESDFLSPVLCYPSRDLAGRPFVSVRIGEAAFSLQPADCRAAADTLIAEQAFNGALAVAHDLREAANLSEQKTNTRILSLASPSRTGMATTLILGALIACAVIAARLLGR